MPGGNRKVQVDPGARSDRFRSHVRAATSGNEHVVQHRLPAPGFSHDHVLDLDPVRGQPTTFASPKRVHAFERLIRLKPSRYHEARRTIIEREVAGTLRPLPRRGRHERLPRGDHLVNVDRPPFNSTNQTPKPIVRARRIFSLKPPEPRSKGSHRGILSLCARSAGERVRPSATAHRTMVVRSSGSCVSARRRTRIFQERRTARRRTR